MTEPSDPFEEWLAGRPVEPLSPRPGAFDRIARSARLRRWGRAGGTGAVVLLVIAGVVAVLQGIQGPAPDPGLAPSTVATPSPVAPSSPVVVPPTTPASTAGGHCGTGQLRATVVPGDGAAGHLGLRIVFVNTASGSCTMFGYPGVSFVSGSGTQVNEAAQRAGGPPVKVTVPGGGSAHADLLLTQVGNFPVDACRPVPAAGVRVLPPDETAAVVVPAPQQLCSVPGKAVPQIYPIQPGP